MKSGNKYEKNKITSAKQLVVSFQVLRTQSDFRHIKLILIYLRNVIKIDFF
jgi:hypothetical protein